MERLKVGGQFSGVGAFDQALKDLNVPFVNVYQAEWDKYARTTYLANHGEPEFYVEDVHDTPILEITQKHGSLGIFMSSAPCQAFSLAGKRQGKDDEKGRGILFFQSLERINKPRFFIFENVKGLLSDDKKNKKDSLGRTFNEWLNYLGGKSVNGNEVMFPYEGSVPYHIYWDVLNAKEHGIPQNRERVFIIGIRDDKDNNFQFPKEEPLKHRIKDYLETFENSPYKFKTQEEFDAYMEKYYLSDKMLKYFENRADNFNGGKVNIRDKDSYVTSITASSKSVDISDNFIKDDVRIGTWRTHEDGKGFREMEDGNCPTIPARAREDGSGQPVIKQSVVDANGLNSSECIGSISATYGKGVENYGSRPFIKETTEIGQEPPQVKQINPSKESGGKQFVQTLDTTFNQDVKINNLPNTNINNIFDVKTTDNEKRNAIKILLEMQHEIGKKEVESWGLRIMETIREENLLQQRMYEQGFYGETKKASIGFINTIQQNESIKNVAFIIMRSLPRESWERCSSQRRKSIKQLIRKLDESMQVLPYKNTQTENNLQSEWMRFENKRIRLLRETLSEIQEVWKSINGKDKSIHKDYRIRRLTPVEVFRFMNFPDSVVVNAKNAGVSESQLYKQAGNSIVVRKLAKIIKNLLKNDTGRVCE